MSKKNVIKPLMIVIFVLLIVIGTYFYCDYRLNMEDVYISKYNLSNRTLISENEIETIRVPTIYLNDEVLLLKENIIGKYVKIGTSIPKGSFFYKGALDDIENMKDNINGELLNGEVSYDISTNEINVNQAYLLKGMYVDLYLTINKDKVLSNLLINNLKIIGLYDINHREIKEYDKESILGTICLAVPSESVSYLNKARVLGELNIVVGNDTYNDVESKLNRKSEIFEYLD